MRAGARARARARAVSATAVSTIALCLLAAVLLVFAAPAAAKETRLPLGAFGAAAQPSFTRAVGLAVEQSSGDLYVIDTGRDEAQQVKVSATAGQFRLSFGGKTTVDLAFNASNSTVKTALRNLSSIGSEGVDVGAGPGDASGSNPYSIGFTGPLQKTDVEQLGCENGAVPLSGGSGCTVETTQSAVSSTISRYKPNGEPDPFSALASNAIDGSGPGEDQTPANRLLGVNGVAVDDSGGATDGNIYVAEGQLANESYQPLLHLVFVFAASGKYLGQLTEYKEGPTASGPLKPLNLPCGIAVDPAGDVYLGDTTLGDGVANFAIHKYHPAANPVANADNVANFALGSFNTFSCDLAAGAGPTAGYLFSSGGAPGSAGAPEVFKLNSSSGAKQYSLLGNEGPLKNVEAVAVDPANGRVFAGTISGPQGEVREYDASGPTEAKFLLGTATPAIAIGLAVDENSGDIYQARREVSHLEAYGPPVTIPDVSTEAATGIGPAAATLHGTISADNGPGAGCHFQYLIESAYQAQLKAAEEARKAEPKTNAEIAAAAFAGAASAPCEPAGPFSGAGPNAVSGKAEPLSHEAKYRFRIVGENEHGSSAGDHQSTPAAPCPGEFTKTCTESFETFGKPQVKAASASEVTTTTAEISGEVNPAGQATSYAVQYVTQADFKASGYNKATSVPVPAEAIGSAPAFVAVSQALTELSPDTAYRFRLTASNADGTRTGPEGTFATFAPPTAGLPEGRAWELVSPAVRMGEVFTPEQGARLGLGGSCRSCTPGWSADKAPMQSSPDGNAVAYEGEPFTTGLAAEANSYVSRRAQEGGWQTAPLSEPQFEAQVFQAFSPDLSKAVMLQVSPALSAEAPADYANLYLREEGKGLVTLITSKPPNRSAGKGDNSFKVAYAGANAGTEAAPAFSHVIFGANDALTPALAGTAPAAPPVAAGEADLYEWSGGQLRLVNVLPGNATASANATIGSGSADFDHAISDDGSRIFWSARPSGQVYVREGAASTTKVPDPGKFLTATPDGAKVLLSDGILYDLQDKTLTDLTGGAGGFQGMAGAAEDLSRIYFVDTKALTPPSEANENPLGPEHAEEGKPNLYLSEGGAVSFIGALLAVDNPTAGGLDPGVWQAAPRSRLAQASADGRFLAFESRARLSGYDNTVRGVESCIGSGTAGPPQCFEVFEYDAASQTLTCPSCNPSGVRPLGGSNLSLINSLDSFARQPDNLPPEGEGRLFFESLDALVAGDTNGRIQDIYEFEPNGVGSCARARGCLSLISSGHGPNDSHFIDASATGDDAFFVTYERLAPFDGNDLMDLYDARVGGGFEFSPLEPCLGEACKGPGSEAGAEQSPGSAGFAANEPPPPPPRPCRKGFVRRHGRCVKAHKRHSKRHAQRAGHRRGGSK